MTKQQRNAADWLAVRVLSPVRYEDNPPYEAEHGIGVALDLMESLVELTGNPLDSHDAVQAVRAAYDSLWSNKTT